MKNTCGIFDMYYVCYGKKQVNDGTIDDIVMRKIRSEMKAEVLGVNDAKKVFSP